MGETEYNFHPFSDFDVCQHPETWDNTCSIQEGHPSSAEELLACDHVLFLSRLWDISAKAVVEDHRYAFFGKFNIFLQIFDERSGDKAGKLNPFGNGHLDDGRKVRIISPKCDLFSKMGGKSIAEVGLKRNLAVNGAAEGDVETSVEDKLLPGNFTNTWIGCSGIVAFQFELLICVNH